MPAKSAGVSAGSGTGYLIVHKQVAFNIHLSLDAVADDAFAPCFHGTGIRVCEGNLAGRPPGNGGRNTAKPRFGHVKFIDNTNRNGISHSIKESFVQRSTVGSK